MKKELLQTVLLTVMSISLGVLATHSLLEGRLSRLWARSDELESWERAAENASPVQQGDGSIRIVEFSDFQCPYCGRVQETLQELEKKYPGKISILYRHLPLAMHAHAVAAAEASECANLQGKFRGYHDALFSQQDSIGVKSWESFASEAGVHDLRAFAECLENRTTQERVASDQRLAGELGFKSTPSFIVNGSPVTGAIPIETFEKLIE